MDDWDLLLLVPRDLVRPLESRMDGLTKVEEVDDFKLSTSLRCPGMACSLLDDSRFSS